MKNVTTIFIFLSPFHSEAWNRLDPLDLPSHSLTDYGRID
jgi:hypothetical protein